MNKLRISKTYDIRPIDFHTGKRIPVSSDQMKVCQCCGMKIVKITELTNGDIIGTNCAELIRFVRPELPGLGLKNFGASKKQLNYFTNATKKIA